MAAGAITHHTGEAAIKVAEALRQMQDDYINNANLDAAMVGCISFLGSSRELPGQERETKVIELCAELMNMIRTLEEMRLEAKLAAKRDKP